MAGINPKPIGSENSNFSHSMRDDRNSRQMDQRGSFAIPEEGENDSTHKNERASMMTIRSKDSQGVEQQNEMLAHLADMHELIKEDEWFNIPAPIRRTCEGIIDFQDKMTHSIVWNAEMAHKKVINLLDK